jgi:serine/threonine protein kinase, bacterial
VPAERSAFLLLPLFPGYLTDFQTRHDEVRCASASVLNLRSLCSARPVLGVTVTDSIVATAITSLPPGAEGGHHADRDAPSTPAAGAAHGRQEEHSMRARASLVGRVVGLCAVAWVTAASAQQAGPAPAGIRAAPDVTVAVMAADLAGPRGLLVDRSGNLLVAEESAGRIVRVSVDGRKTRIAEGIRAPHDLELDAAGNIYVAETPTGKILAISPAGEVSTYIDGLGTPVDLGFNRNGELLVCELSTLQVTAYRSRSERRVLVSGFRPHGLAFDGAGATYVNDLSNSRLVRVAKNGEVTQVAGDLELLIGVAIGPSGDLYVAERDRGRLVRVDPAGTTTIVLQGLTTPRDPAFDSAGNLYVAETDAGRVLKVSGRF